MTDQENDNERTDQSDREAELDATPNDRQPGDSRSGEWTEATYPVVDADFIGDTLDRVLHDRDEIVQEASRCEDIQFHRADLQAYCLPPLSAGFVERTLKKVLAERDAGRRLRSAEDDEFHALMENATVPAPSPGFVDRTLELVMQDRATTQILRPVLARPFSLMASAAAIILCAVAIFWRGDTPLDSVTQSTLRIATPVAWAPLVNETEAQPELGLPIEAPDELETFAYELGGGR